MLAPLAWLGRQGPRALAFSVLLGIAVPPVGRALRPVLTEAVFLMLTVAFLRIDMTRLRALLRRPGLIAAGTLWTTIGVPLLLHAVTSLAGLGDRAPDLLIGMMLHGLAPPVMATPSLALLMGLDATLALVVLVAATAIVPLTASLLAPLVLGPALALPATLLALRLGGLLGGAMLLGLLIRRFLGSDTIERRADILNGVNIVIMFVFIAVVLSDLAATAWANPIEVASIAGLVFLVAGGLFLLTALLFRRTGPERACSFGLLAALRNMGLMVAALTGALPDQAWLYFALCQFPIYFSPLLLGPLLRRLKVQPTPAA